MRKWYAAILRAALSCIVCHHGLLHEAYAQPQDSDIEQNKIEKYQKWVKDTYLPHRQAEYERMKGEVEEGVASWAEGEVPDYSLGNSPEAAQSAAEWDENHIMSEQFGTCNDNWVDQWGDPESRENTNCREKTGFFDEANPISFSCASNKFENSCGSDRETGNEIAEQICTFPLYPEPCGVHLDNKHHDKGGMIGAGIMQEDWSPCSNPFLRCCPFIISGSYVEYFFPWNMINVSRKKYHSTYLDKDFVAAVREPSHNEAALAAIFAVPETINLTNQALVNQLPEQALEEAPEESQEGASQGSAAMNVHQSVQKSLQALAGLDLKFRDLSSHGTTMYARNFSSVIDIRFMQSVYWSVPHWAKDSHRFGTDLPSALSLAPIPLPVETLESIDLSDIAQKQSKGGNLFSRFLSIANSPAAAPTGGKPSAKLPELLQALIATGGPRTCIRNNKISGKTPGDFLNDAAQGDDTLCLDKIGPRFPLTAFSFSPYDTDGIWRGLASGGIDLFYALNFPAHFDAYKERGLDPAKTIPPSIIALAEGNAPFHTFMEKIDRFAVVPNPDSSNLDFAEETPQCKPLDDMLNYAPSYHRANIHDPKKAAQNTIYLYGYAKGVWGFKGQRPKRVIPNGRSRYPEIYVRFN